MLQTLVKRFFFFKSYNFNSLENEESYKKKLITTTNKIEILFKK